MKVKTLNDDVLLRADNYLHWLKCQVRDDTDVYQALYYLVRPVCEEVARRKLVPHGQRKP